MLRNLLANVAKEAGEVSSGALVGDGGHLECSVWGESTPAKVAYSATRVRKLPAPQAAAIAERLDGASAKALLARDKRVSVRRALTRNPFLDSSTARDLYAWGREQGLEVQEETTLCNGMLSSDLATLANERRYSTARRVLIGRISSSETLPEEASDALGMYLQVLAGSEVTEWESSSVNQILAFVASDRIPVPSSVVKVIVENENLWEYIERLGNLQEESIDVVLAWAKETHRYKELPSGVTGSSYGIEQLAGMEVEKLDNRLVWRLLETQRDAVKYCEYFEKVLDSQANAIRSWHRLVPMAIEARNWRVLEKAFGVGNENVVRRLVDSVERDVRSMESAPKTLWEKILPHCELGLIRKACEYGHYKPTDNDIVRATKKAARASYLRDGDAWAWALQEVPMGKHAALPVVQIGFVRKWVLGGCAANPVTSEAIAVMLEMLKGRDPVVLQEILKNVELPGDTLAAVLKAATSEEAGHVVEAWFNGEFPPNPVQADVVRVLYNEQWESLKWYLLTSQRLLSPAGVVGCDDILLESTMYMWVMQQVNGDALHDAGVIQPHARWVWEVLYGEFGENEQAWQHLGHYLDSWKGTLGGLVGTVRALIQ